MNILTSPTFWVIIGAIILIMALIGYLAEGTDLTNKALNKKPKEKKEKEEPKQAVEEVVPVPVTDINAQIFPEQNNWQANLDSQLGNSVVTADAPIEVLKVQDEPNAWSDNAPAIDERQETVHTVPTVDDWSMIPTETSNEVLPEVQLENPNEPETKDSEMFPDIKPSDLETPVSIEEPVINNDTTSNEDIWKA